MSVVASALTLNWAALLAILGGLVAGTVVVLVWVIRNGHNRRVRFGVFVERETERRRERPERPGASEADTEIWAPDGD